MSVEKTAEHIGDRSAALLFGLVRFRGVVAAASVEEAALALLVLGCGLLFLFFLLFAEEILSRTVFGQGNAVGQAG